MTCIDSTISAVAATAKRVGLGVLAAEAGVPYTTVKSFADRKWSHKSLSVIKALAEASERLDAANDSTPQEKAA